MENNFIYLPRDRIALLHTRAYVLNDNIDVKGKFMLINIFIYIKQNRVRDTIYTCLTQERLDNI